MEQTQMKEMMQKMRRKDREVTDFSEQVGILSRCRQIVIGMVDNGMPYMVPVDFGWKVKDGKVSLYAHSAPVGKKINLWKQNSHVSFVAAHSFRIGLGNTANNWTNAFESVMGTAEIVFLDDFKERLESIQLLMDRYDMGTVPEEAYGTVKAMACYRIDIKTMTGKSNLTHKQRTNWGWLEATMSKITDSKTTLHTVRELLDSIEIDDTQK